MKGIVLAGGTGSRLKPLTDHTNKHMLPVYDRPMIYHPIQTLVQAGLRDILIVTGGEHLGQISSQLTSDSAFPGVEFHYRTQKGAGGIAQALGLAKDFANEGDIAVILGDNIFQDSFTLNDFYNGAKIFLKEVPDPERFGVAEIKEGKLVGIEEKPGNPKSSYAVTGLYLYDPRVFAIIRTLEPSGRKELEITDVNNAYIRAGCMEFEIIKGYWTDAGTFNSLLRANLLAARKSGDLSEILANL